MKACSEVQTQAVQGYLLVWGLLWPKFFYPSPPDLYTEILTLKVVVLEGCINYFSTTVINTQDKSTYKERRFRLAPSFEDLGP